jgi:Ca2+-dependent lipid-binding protein
METFANVLIYEAKNLKNTQIIGRQSPYATVSTTSAPGRHLQRTATYVSGGDVAVWNEYKESVG